MCNGGGGRGGGVKLDEWHIILSSLSAAFSVVFLHMKKTRQALRQRRLLEILSSRRTDAVYHLQRDMYKHVTLLHISGDNL